MRIIADLGWLRHDEDVSCLRDEANYVYQLMAYGDGCPERMRVFYVGVTNNPVARLIEHTYRPHSGALEAVMDQARMLGWEIEMSLVDMYQDRKAAEIAEKKLITEHMKAGYFQLMNMEAMYGPVMAWISDNQPALPEEGQHDAHVLAFTRKG